MKSGVFFGLELNNPFLLHTVNECKIRLKSSLLLWCYFGCIFLVLLPGLLSFIFSYPPPFTYLEVLDPFLFFSLLFFPISLNIFSRERQHLMLDYMVMSSTRFKPIFFSRMFANAFLMIFPLVIGFLLTCVFGLMIKPSISFLFLLMFFIPIIFFFFLNWYLLSSLILSICDLRFTSSMMRVFIHYFTLLVVIIILLVIDLLIAPIPIVGIFFGSTLFTNLPLSFFTIIISCIILIWLLSEVLNRLIKRVIKHVTSGGQNLIISNLIPGSEFYAVVETIKSNKITNWQYSLPILNIFPYFILFIISPDTSLIVDDILKFFCFHFVIILLVAFLTIFPRIAAEKEYKMEEMILTRITAYRYFFVKVSLLIKPIFLNLLIATIAIIIFFRPEIPSFLHLLVNFFFRSLYLVAILIFIWRLFPAKDLLQSTALSIFGFEVLGLLVSIFLFPGLGIFIILFSPIIGSLFLSIYISDPNAIEIILTVLWLLSLLIISLFLASIVLIKSEIRYE